MSLLRGNNSIYLNSLQNDRNTVRFFSFGQVGSIFQFTQANTEKRSSAK